MKSFLKVFSLALIVILAVVLLTGCGTKKEEATKATIVGSWKYDGGNYTYTFNEDGTGTYDVGSTKMEFTYTTEGNKLSILYTGNTAPMETEYSINGDTLNVVDSFGNDTLYKKVK